MNTRTTWSLLLVAAILFGYIVFFELHTSKEAGKEQEKSRLFSKLNPELVSAIEVRRTNWIVRVEKIDGEWKVAKPSYPAEANRVRHFLETASRLPREMYISAEDLAKQGGGKDSFGLENAEASILIEQGSDQFRFQIGAKTLVKDQVYVQLLTDPGIYVTSHEILKLLPVNSAEWRNPMLCYKDQLTYDRLTLSSGPNVIELQKNLTNELWHLTKPLTDRADFHAISYLIQLLRHSRVNQFVSDNPAADLETFGLQSPKVDLALTQGTNTIFQLQFGGSPADDPSQVYVRNLLHGNIMLVTKRLLEALPVSYEHYRDHNLAFFPASSVSRIDITSADGQIILERNTNGVWRIMEPFQASADPEIVKGLIEDLGRIRIVKFEKDVVQDFSAYGLDKPRLQYALKSNVPGPSGMTNNLLTHIDFGSNQVDTVFARRSDEKSVYRVSSGDYNRLPQAAFQVRDRQVWDFPGSNVIGISISHKGRTRKLERNASGVWNEDIIVNTALEETLLKLGQMRALEWRSKGDNQLYKRVLENGHQISFDVKSNGVTNSLTLALGPKTSAGAYSSVILEEKQPITFIMPAGLHSEVLNVFSIPVELSSGQ